MTNSQTWTVPHGQTKLHGLVSQVVHGFEEL
jgi:hypothetical protein